MMLASHKSLVAWLFLLQFQCLPAPSGQVRSDRQGLWPSKSSSTSPSPLEEAAHCRWLPRFVLALSPVPFPLPSASRRCHDTARVDMAVLNYL